MGLPPLELWAPCREQVVSFKNLCDRLIRFRQKRSRRWAIIFVLLSAGLPREDRVRLDLHQAEPNVNTSPWSFGCRRTALGFVVGIAGRTCALRRRFLAARTAIRGLPSSARSKSRSASARRSVSVWTWIRVRTGASGRVGRTILATTLRNVRRVAARSSPIAVPSQPKTSCGPHGMKAVPGQTDKKRPVHAGSANPTRSQ